MRGVQVEEERGEPEGGTQDDPGGQVASAGSTDPDQFHRPGGDQVHGHEPVKRADPHQEGGRTTGGADIGEGVAGESLATHDGESADHARDDGDDATHDQCHVYGGA